MPDEPTAGHLSVQDAIRLKHSLNQSIPWGNSNLNAIEIENLTKLSAEDYSQIRKEYREWHKKVDVSPFVLLLLLLVCVGSYIYFSNIWLKIMGISIGVSCFYSLAKRDGHAEGYIDGYDAGHEAGIYKTLNIKPEQLADLHDMATDMKIDGTLLERIEKRQQLTESKPEGTP